ncbi:hypothetical protein NC652_040504 [Populus alba x Populus x berolinensis]|nr:hypothetical protein NC652_040504 [Populus alba x Populus x berolinensis]
MVMMDLEGFLLADLNALSGFSFVLLIASSNAIDGPDVRAEFEKAGINTHFIPFIRKEASKLISTIVGVFEACDSLVLMHRDLKPDNLLFHSVQKHPQIGPKLLCPSIPALVCHVKALCRTTLNIVSVCLAFNEQISVHHRSDFPNIFMN